MEFLEVPLFDDDLYKMLVRFAINLLVVLAITLGCYREHQKGDGYIFTYLLLNIMVFFICFALKKLELQLGLALGLFAIFAIIRYRTDTIRVHEMTYLFVVVGIAVINALSNKKTSYAELAATNGIVIVSAYILEKVFAFDRPKRAKQSIIYDKLELLKPDNYASLVQDIAARTGLVAEDIKIAKIDLQKGSATIVVYYTPPEVEDDGDEEVIL